ncbi:MAG: Mfa1 family fimbria major subunit [Candidatus Azobacteroides sp.]|nr:Mfa1 family fimbria major subunit [Candidatus Azobacteroides sp.]
MMLIFNPILIMKNKFKTVTLTCAILAIVGFMTSCNNEDVPGNKTNPSPEGEGEATWTSLSISFPKTEAPVLRAAADDDYETAIHSVDVFIYSGDDAHYSSHTRLSRSDFQDPVTSGNNVVYTSKPSTIPTTTGEKKIFVGVNLPDTSALIGNPAVELKNVARTFNNISSLVSTTNGITMTNVGDSLVTNTFTNVAANNVVNATVQRMAAKVTVAEASNINVEGVEGAIIGNLKWTINNFNTKSFLLQNIGSDGSVIDPNYLEGEYVAGDFVAATANSTFLTVQRGAGSSLTPSYANLDPSYTTENTSDLQRKKEITSVLIRAQFIPRNIIVQQNGSFVNATTARTSAATFYSLIVMNGAIPEIAFFEDSSTAAAYASLKNVNSNDIQTYQDGYCYWDLFLHDGTYNFQVVRNNYYRCAITRIIFPGRSTVTIPSPDDKPDVPTTISADITVIPWTEIALNAELLP